MSFQEGQPIYIAIKGVVFDVTSGKGELSLKKEKQGLPVESQLGKETLAL